MQNFVQDGDDVTVTAPYALTPGQGCLFGALFGVAKGTAASGAKVVLCTEGVFDITKKAGDTPTPGGLIYWDDTNKYLTTTAAGNKLVGCTLRAALGGDPTARVRLNSVAS